MLNTRKLSSIIIILILMLPGLSLYAQTTKISGKILDENNLPLAGVNVYPIGATDQGTISNVDGEYTIESELNSTLVFSYIGYKILELEATSPTINVSLEVESVGLEEVVAIGYGSVRKKDLSSSISVVAGDNITKTASTPATAGGVNT